MSSFESYFRSLLRHPKLYNKGCLPRKKKIPVTGIVIIGDSLSDSGGKNGEYAKKFFGCIPARLFLHKSPHQQFTNGFVWSYPLVEKLKWTLKKEAKPLDNIHLAATLDAVEFSKNRAQGGTTACDYSGLCNFIKHIKGFFLSFFLDNIQKQAKNLKKNRSLRQGDLCLIFAGANDLLTVGYNNSGGAYRAVAGISNTLRILTTPTKKDDKLNLPRNVVLFTLPDFSKTPRFSKKSDKEKEQAKQTCALFNQELRNLAKNYQYIDFSSCDIYQIFDDIEKLDKIVKNIKREGIVLVGSGKARKVYFVQNNEIIKNLVSREAIEIDINLSEVDRNLLGEYEGKIQRNAKNTLFINDFVQQLTSKAKLNVDVNVFDAAAVFEEIDANPEKYGFTSGCSVYYLENSEQKIDTISGNAIIFTREKGNSDHFLCEFVKDGELLIKTVQFKLSEKEQIQLKEKIEGHPKRGLIQLAGKQDKHDTWTTHIIQYALAAYLEKFEEKLQLADVYTSVLMAIKEHYANHELIFWDDLHPTVTTHFLLEMMFEKFFKDNYLIGNPKPWIDDTLILGKLEPKPKLPPQADEAPNRIRTNGR